MNILKFISGEDETIEDIIGDFRQKVNRLRNLAERDRARAKELANEAEEKLAEAQRLHAELTLESVAQEVAANHCTNVANKIEAFIEK